MNRIQQEIIFFKNHAENEAGRLVPDLFIKALYEVKASGPTGYFQYNLKAFHLAYKKNCMKL